MLVRILDANYNGPVEGDNEDCFMRHFDEMGDGRLRRVLRAEPLERRWLLSGAPASTDVGPEPGEAAAPAVEVLELAPADDDEIDEDERVEYDDLPGAVRAALNARFPGAPVREVTVGEEDDGTLEYDAVIDQGDATLAATFSAGGELIETERAVPAADLPGEVLAWVGEQFPGAAIGEAVAIEGEGEGEQNYEIVVTDPSGEQFEATLRGDTDAQIPVAEPPGSSDEAPPAPATPPRAASAPRETFVRAPANRADTPAGDADADAAQRAAAAATPAVAVAAQEQVPDQSAPAVEEAAAAGAVVESALLASSPRAVPDAIAARQTLIAGRGDGDAGQHPAPGAADFLAGLLPIDAGITERAINHLLRDIDRIAANAASASATRPALTGVAAIALAFGGHLLVRRLSAATGDAGPLVAREADEATWMWRLSTPRHPRTDDSPTRRADR